MLDHLKAEINSFEQNLRAQVGPSDLHSEKALNLFSYYAAQSDYIYIFHRFPSLSKLIVSPLLDIVLGYEAGSGPSANRELLADVFTSSLCFDEVNKYLLNFNISGSGDFDGSIKLLCTNGSQRLFPYQSHVMHGFPGSDTGIITLMDSDFESLPKKKKSKKELITRSQTSILLISYQSLTTDLRNTLHCLEKGYTNEETGLFIHKSVDSINKYVRQLKNIFKVEETWKLRSISQYCRRFPAR